MRVPGTRSRLFVALALPDQVREPLARYLARCAGAGTRPALGTRRQPPPDALLPGLGGAGGDDADGGPPGGRPPAPVQAPDRGRSAASGPLPARGCSGSVWREAASLSRRSPARWPGPAARRG